MNCSKRKKQLSSAGKLISHSFVYFYFNLHDVLALNYLFYNATLTRNNIPNNWTGIEIHCVDSNEMVRSSLVSHTERFILHASHGVLNNIHDH
jgi:hypothetical protein